VAISEADIRRRIGRLEAVALGLTRERVAWERAEDPLLYLERRAYLAAIRTAIHGVEGARVVLAKACQRLDGERKQGREDHGAATATDRAGA
jgi:hypothetical protein